MDEIDPSADTSGKIRAAMLALSSEGGKLNHDNVAARAGVSRRTVYRRYPDQNALRQGLWGLISIDRPWPNDIDAWLSGGLHEHYRCVESRADEMVLALATLEGRAMRNALKEPRTAAYLSLYAEATARLPEPDRTWAIGALQFLGSAFPWIGLADQWGMDEEASATAMTWAIRTLLADLAKRGATPLNQDSPDQPS